MSIALFINNLAAEGIFFEVNDSKLSVKAKKGAMTKAIMAELKEKKAEVLAFLSDAQPVLAINVVDSALPVPLSFSQQRLWMLDQIDGGSLQYNMPGAFRLKGDVSVEALQQAFDKLLERHSVLRTVYIEDQDGWPWQHVLPVQPLPMVFTNLTEQPQPEQVLKQLVDKCSQQPFNLHQDLMLRVELVKMADDEYVVLATMHHIASDGWSMGIMINEFSAIYRALVSGQTPELPQLAIQYADYAHWQHEQLQGEELTRQLDYWQQQLAGLPTVHQLPLDFPRAKQTGHKGHSVVSHIDKTTTEQLLALCQREGATLFMGLHAAFSLLLSRYSNESDIVLGTPVANREQQEVSALIGFFANTLVLRTEVSESFGFVELLRQSKATLLSAYQYQQIPFEKLVEELQPQRSQSHSPLFQIMLVLQNNAEGELDLPGVTLTPVEQSQASAQFELSLDVGENEQGLLLSWNYSAGLFRESTITRMAQHFTNLVQSVLSNPQQPLLSLPMLSEPEHQQLLQQTHGAQVQLRKEQGIFQLFEQQAAQNPTNVAVVFEDQSLSYAELNQQANQLAHYLINERGVTPDTLVGICLTRSVEMVVAIVAILKAGGAYVPLDPDYPVDRLGHILEESQMSSVLTTTALADLIELNPQHAILLDSEPLQQTLQSQPDDNPNVASLTCNHLAYVIYTSGSTGKPKGVMVEHRALFNRIDWMQREYHCTPQDNILQKTPYSFDVSVWEFVWPLAYGASLIVAKPDGHKDPYYLASLIEQHQVTKLHFVPSMLASLLSCQLLPACTSIKQVFCSGEALSSENIRQFQQQCSHAQLHNLYGPTEAAIDVSYWDCSGFGQVQGISHAEQATVVPIGKPIQNIQLYILNAALQPCPNGVAGELFIGGVGLARGYLNRPDLTADRFVDNPFNPTGDNSGSSRLYKTGDLARWLPDGNIEYLGRNDFQVKIRGLRIELGEIESSLLAIEGIDEALVIVSSLSGAVTSVDDDAQLVGYYRLSSTANIDQATIKARLTEVLPLFMVPAFLIALAQFPKTNNGKVDKQALPEPLTVLDGSQYVAPANDIEHQLVEIWSRVLKIEPSKLSTQSSLFDLGGHSILTIQLRAKMKEAGLAFTTKDLFDNPTIASLTQCYYQRQGDMLTMPVLGEAVIGEPIKSLPNRRMFCQGVYNDHFNSAMICQIENAEPQVLAKAIYETMMSHEGMRHSFYRNEQNEVIETILAIDADDILERVDLSYLVDDDAMSEQIEVLSNQYQRSLNTKTRLHRFILFEPGLGRNARFVCIVNHMLVDGYSFPIFTDELSVRYLAAVAGEPCPKFAKSDSLREWSAHVHHYVNHVVDVDKTIHYWQAMSWSKVKSIIDYEDGFAHNTSGDKSRYGNDLYVDRRLSKAYSDIMLNGEHGHGSFSERDIIFTAFVKAMAQLTDSEKVYFELFVNGRNNLLPTADASHTVGFLSDYVPIMASVDSQLSIPEQVTAMKRQLDENLSLGVGFNAIKHITENDEKKAQLTQIQVPELSVNFLPNALYQANDDEPLTQPNLPWNLLAPATESFGDIMNNEMGDIISCTYIAVAMIDGCYDLSWICRDNLIKQSTVERALDLWQQEIELLLDGLSKKDVPLAGLVELAELVE